MSAHPRWKVPGYTHGRELGAGACGRVVEALDEASGAPVAIKYLTHGARTAFRAEARLLMRLRSPYVVRIDDYVEHPEGAAIVMELVEGVSLRALLRQEGPTGPEAALTVLKGSLLGLAAAHEAGLVHRDYKPENVLVDLDGRSKLVDFGIAVASGDASGVAGTPPYMAPEQWTGSPVAPVTDVYAATAVFFECLVGSKPYPGTTALELAVQHIEAPIPDDRVPEALRPLVRRGLAKRAVERPPSAAAFVRELDALASGEYGEDWEVRGHRTMAALLALMPMPVRAPDEVVTATTTFADTTLAATTTGTAPAHASVAASGRPRSRSRSRGGVVGRRTSTAVAASAALLLTGVLALSAIAEQDDTEDRVTGTAGSTVSPGTPDSPAGTRSTGPGATIAPTPGQSGTAAGPAADSGTGSKTGSETGSGVESSTVVGSSPSSPGAAPGSTEQAAVPAPSTTNAAPRTPPVAPPATSPTVRVLAVSLSQYGCSGKFGTQAVASVKSDGASTGTLILTWFHSNTRGSGTTVATDRITIPAGQTSFSKTYAHTFGAGDPFPYWGVQVSSDPAPATGSGTYKVLYADDCNPIL
ncbi:serine/threonine protein kinase [Streptomyces xanthophaeus]|uniref:serine/threonine protein kinase n=1 Tax=Streptomyces xanthophaeus TaxID=67385 RepID=UPI00264814C7|nr:serine/threonine protein kinase [Streptomyces xanthophaeus]WKD31163.1 protein kinase [Streptomyces xanthophaeus]